MEKRIVIMGASSGIGHEVAKFYIEAGWKVGVAARRVERLEALKALSPSTVSYGAIDVTQEDASERILRLIAEVGGVDVYFHSSGIGRQNVSLSLDNEIKTLRTNGEGFTRSIDTAFNYMKAHGGGQIAAISSIAGTHGLGVSASYSATKRFQSCYMQALSQLSHMEKLHVRFTDIRPGFVTTDMLDDGHSYPFQLSVEHAARLIVRAINRRKRVAYIDWKYGLLVFAWRLIPNFVWERMPIRTRE